jgi:hypothetical protein
VTTESLLSVFRLSPPSPRPPFRPPLPSSLVRRFVYVHVYVCILYIRRFVISQSISKRGYETVNSAGQKSASLGHVKLAQRMEMREPGTGPVSGDRVQVAVCIL